MPIYLTVTGRDGQPVKGLTATDFILLDGGKPREIAVFSADRRPFSVALVFDSTLSMTRGFGMSRSIAFANAFIQALDSDDQVAIGSLATTVVPLSREKTEALTVLQRSPNEFWRDLVAHGVSQGELPSERGVDRALESLWVAEGRRILVLFTDGRNPEMSGNESRADEEGYRLPALTAEALVRRAEQADASIHAIAFDDTLVQEQFLTAFSSTGGGASLVARDADLVSVCRALVDELHHEYLLGFTPTAFDGKSHKIQVKIKIPGATIRSRTSYLAEKR